MSFSSRTFELPSISNEARTDEEKDELVDQQLAMQEEYALDYESMKGEEDYQSPIEANPDAMKRIHETQVLKRRGNWLARIAGMM